MVWQSVFWPRLDKAHLTLDHSLFLSACVAVDLEVDPKSARLFAFAAVRGEQEVVHKGAALDPALDRWGQSGRW
jgi:hypothetical protein